MAVARMWSIARLTKRAAPCAADQFINCAAFDELRNIWSIAQRTCNGIRVKVSATVRLGLGLRNWLNAQRIWSNAQRVWSNAQIDQMRLTWLGFCFQISRNIYDI